MYIKKNRGKKYSGGCIFTLICMSCLVLVGIFFTVSQAPTESSKGGPSTNSLFVSTAFSSTKKLSEKVTEWIAHSGQMIGAKLATSTSPPWDQEFWTPIDVVDVSSDPMVILCKLNFRKYAADPHLSPMFKDLVGASKCTGNNRRREKLKVLLQEISDNPDAPSSRVIKPNGFVFHESRVGSTLVANFMASDPFSMVFSESNPMANAILHCESCTHEYNVQLFRDITTLMGRSPFHTHLFFKFQSITVTNMHIALEAFPDTPWAFVYRQPVQTMMSHLDPEKNNQGNSPCMRSKHHPAKEVSDVVSKYSSGWSAPNEAWCAAHLNMLCSYALRNYEKYGTRTVATTTTTTTVATEESSSPQQQQQQIQRGMLINYDSLPGFVPQVLLPLFGIQPVPAAWLEKIQLESAFYSKSRGNQLRKFSGDSKDKDSRATEQIQLYADKILQPTYELLNQKAMSALQNFHPTLYASILSKQPSTTTNTAGSDVTITTEKQLASSSLFDWKALSVLPPSTSGLMPVPSLAQNSDTINRFSDAGSEDNIVSGIGGSSSSVLTPTGLVGAGRSTVLPIMEYNPTLPFANHHSSKPFMPANCPLHPEPTYPEAFSMIDITNNWNADNTVIPPQHYDSLCHFDHQNATQLQQAYNYRDKEVPFIVYNIPEVDAVVKKWNDLDYLSDRLGGHSKTYRTETSKDNHFMYWKHARGKFLRTDAGRQWKEPTQIVSTSFDDWIELAVKNHNKSIEVREHQYFRVSSDQGNGWLFNELPFFKPVKSLMLVNPREQKGIHCRFGMRSVIAEAHFDGSRNSVVELAGLRRWVMTHPNQCSDMHMLDNSHPSGRHSAVDWSQPNLTKYPHFAKVKGNEVILQPGDMLFVPTYWIHYIVSLSINMQCNSRSGKFHGYDSDISKCGFAT